MGDSPDFTGQVETFEDQRIGRIALWINEREGKNQPEFTGRISFYNGKKKFKIAVWENEDEEEEVRNTIPAFLESGVSD